MIRLHGLEAIDGGNKSLPVALVEPALEYKAAYPMSAKAVTEPLTARKEKLVQLAVEGLLNKEIARRLSVTEGAVEIQLYIVYQKLRVANRAALADFALQ